jgi:hypothetical protein
VATLVQDGEAMSHMGPPSGRTLSTRRSRGSKRGSGGQDDAQGPGGGADDVGLQAGVRKSARVGTRAAGGRGQSRAQEDAGAGVMEMSQQVGGLLYCTAQLVQRGRLHKVALLNACYTAQQMPFYCSTVRPYWRCIA